MLDISGIFLVVPVVFIVVAGVAVVFIVVTEAWTVVKGVVKFSIFSVFVDIFSFTGIVVNVPGGKSVAGFSGHTGIATIGPNVDNFMSSCSNFFDFSTEFHIFLIQNPPTLMWGLAKTLVVHMVRWTKAEAVYT